MTVPRIVGMRYAGGISVEVPAQISAGPEPGAVGDVGGYMLPILLACTEPTVPDTATEVDPRTWDALTADVDDLSDRVTAREGAEPRFAAGGPPATVEAFWQPAMTAVVVENEGGVRYRRDDRGLTLLFWLDPGDLVEVVAVDAWLGPDGRMVTDGGPAVWVPPGTPVDEEGRVHLPGWPLSGSVEVAPGLVDTVWSPGGAPAAAEGESLTVDDVVLRDDDGEPFAEVVHGIEARLVEDDGDALLIEVEMRPPCENDRYLARGWVDADEAQAGGRGRLWSTWCCGTGRWYGVPWIGGDEAIVAEGTLVYDAPGGAVIGRAEVDAKVSLDGDEVEVDGLRALRVQTGLGFTVVWAAVTDWEVELPATP